MNLAGSLLGAIVGSTSTIIGFVGLYICMCVVLLAMTLVTVFSIPEPLENFSDSHNIFTISNTFNKRRESHDFEGSQSLLNPHDQHDRTSIDDSSTFVDTPARNMSLKQQIYNVGTLIAEVLSPLFKNRDFGLVFASRLLFQLGIATVQQFLQYWISDCVDSPFPSAEAVSIALLPLLIISPIAALFISNITSKNKSVAYLAATLMAFSCVLMLFVHSFLAACFVSLLFGIGYGPFLSVEFSMVLQVLPDTSSVGKDLSLWHSALVLPQIFATPIAGWFRDYFQWVGRPEGLNITCLGYKFIYFVCIGYFVGGAVVTRLIKSIV
ncbi:hypothetical protein HK098_004651 [Nowakowskiella sp. JEL0407]|nr:hypothetical protein HK098_004651 [Nowakowskiella sp. JEL0407]